MLLELLCCYGWACLDLSWPGHKGKWTHQVCLAYAEGGLNSPPKKHRAGSAASNPHCVTRGLYEDEKVSPVLHPT